MQPLNPLVDEWAPKVVAVVVALDEDAQHRADADSSWYGLLNKKGLLELKLPPKYVSISGLVEPLATFLRTRESLREAATNNSEHSALSKLLTAALDVPPPPAKEVTEIVTSEPVSEGSEKHEQGGCCSSSKRT